MADPARDSATIRDGILRVERSGLINLGVQNPNVTPGSAAFVRATAVANQLVVVEANGQTATDRALPDTAQDEELKRLCEPYGLFLRDAAGSIGPVVVASDGPFNVAAGDKLIDGAGLEFEATETKTVSSGDTVQIKAKATGEATNHPEGDVLRWANTPPLADEKVTVGIGGLVNGVDAEDIEGLRQRFYAVLQEPPLSGNSQHVAMWGERSSPNVQKTFVYPILQGAGSMHVAVTAAPTATNKSRVLTSLILTGTVIPSVLGEMPEPVQNGATITTVQDVPVDVAFALTLPEAATASPPGPGGGWTDGSPWPAPDGASSFRTKVTAVTSTTVFTVDALTAPTPTITKICWLSPLTWTLYTATVIGVTGTSGAYVITLDQAFPGIAIGNYIWPSCQNAQAYVDAVLKSFSMMGPGEKTSDPKVLVRGYRHPRPAASWPMTLGGHLLSAITDAQDEVDAATFLHRTDGTVTLTGPAGLIYPQLPAVVTDGPRIFVPKNLAFYRTP